MSDKKLIGPRGPQGPQGAQGIQGQQGRTGERGPRGLRGPDGKSAYDIWIALGNTGTEQDFIEAIALAGFATLNFSSPTLSYNAETHTLTIDNEEITDGGNF